MVNLMSWNVRGLNYLNKQKKVKLLHNEQEIGLVGLLKTRIKVNKVNNIAYALFGGWKYRRTYSSHYNKHETAQATTCQVRHISLGLRFVVTFVYAFNQNQDRREL